MAGLFGEIRANIGAAVIDVTYDELGYPTLIDIDPDFDVIDDELTITATITVRDR